MNTKEPPAEAIRALRASLERDEGCGEDVNTPEFRATLPQATDDHVRKITEEVLDGIRARRAPR